MRQYADAVTVYRENCNCRRRMTRCAPRWHGSCPGRSSPGSHDVISRDPGAPSPGSGYSCGTGASPPVAEAIRGSRSRIPGRAPIRPDACRGEARPRRCAHWQGHYAESVQRYEALVAETHDPELEAQLKTIRSNGARPRHRLAEHPASTHDSQGTDERVIGPPLKKPRNSVAKQYPEAERVYRDVPRRHPDNDDIRTALARVLSWQALTRKRRPSIVKCWLGT